MNERFVLNNDWFVASHVSALHPVLVMAPGKRGRDAFSDTEYEPDDSECEPDNPTSDDFESEDAQSGIRQATRSSAHPRRRACVQPRAAKQQLPKQQQPKQQQPKHQQQSKHQRHKQQQQQPIQPPGQLQGNQQWQDQENVRDMPLDELLRARACDGVVALKGIQHPALPMMLQLLSAQTAQTLHPPPCSFLMVRMDAAAAAQHIFEHAPGAQDVDKGQQGAALEYMQQVLKLEAALKVRAVCCAVL